MTPPRKTRRAGYTRAPSASTAAVFVEQSREGASPLGAQSPPSQVQRLPYRTLGYPRLPLADRRVLVGTRIPVSRSHSIRKSHPARQLHGPQSCERVCLRSERLVYHPAFAIGSEPRPQISYRQDPPSNSPWICRYSHPIRSLGRAAISPQPSSLPRPLLNPSSSCHHKPKAGKRRGTSANLANYPSPCLPVVTHFTLSAISRLHVHLFLVFLAQRPGVQEHSNSFVMQTTAFLSHSMHSPFPHLNRH